MRLNVHDYSGHPFQVQLSRELAARGHSVMHGFSSQYVTGHGRLTVEPSDPATLRIEALSCRRPLVKYSPRARLRFELSYAEAWRNRLEEDPADVVVACNVPMFALDRMRKYFRRHGQPWVLWHQDLYSLGVGAEVARAIRGRFASGARSFVERVERLQVASASAVVAITPAMPEQYQRWGIHRDVLVQPNWAPLDEIRPGRRDNPWARQHEMPHEPLRLMYAGTLGRKHNPLLLLDILDATQLKGVSCVLVVASEGVGVDELALAAAGRPDVRIVGYQPAEALSDMLASADAVVALLEPDAARFSVPSKVLSYLSAGKPIIALMPSDNPASVDVRGGGGFVGEPKVAGATAAAGWLADVVGRSGELTRIGRTARARAEEQFGIDVIADRFERVLEQAMASTRRRRTPSVPAWAAS